MSRSDRIVRAIALGLVVPVLQVVEDAAHPRRTYRRWRLHRDCAQIGHDWQPLRHVIPLRVCGHCRDLEWPPSYPGAS